MGRVEMSETHWGSWYKVNGKEDGEIHFVGHTCTFGIGLWENYRQHMTVYTLLQYYQQT
jgi:hypothetical protein